jgi:hypothetical protein
MSFENNYQNCYNFKKITFPNGLLDEAVDATYIIHLEGNGRYENILKQLELYQPTKIVYIVFNKGFKNCEKDKNISLPAHDLVDAFLEIFKHSNGLSQNYGNILILEDDFIFSEKIKDTTNCVNICTFLNNHKNQDFQYLLGCIPLMQVPCTQDCKHYKIIASLATHSVIYTKSNREKILQVEQTKIVDWDKYSNFNIERFLYCEPLCYQLFPETENSKHWGDNQFLKLFFTIVKGCVPLLKLDTQVEPGYSICYFLSKIILFFILFILFIIIYKIVKNMFIKNKKNKKIN